MMNQVGGDTTSKGTNAGISESVARQQSDATEKSLTHFAMYLAMLEKGATGLGTMGFIWATVVLLGGFAVTLDKTDFWFITIILVLEGTRIFSTSHELEWQHQATWSNADAITPSSGNFIQYLKAMICRSNSSDEENQPSPVQQPAMIYRSNSQPVMICRSNSKDEENQPPPVQQPAMICRSNSTSNMENKPPPNLFFVTQNIIQVWYWLQLLSATACVVLSLYKLIKRNFGHIEKGDTDKKNREHALIIFYSLVLAESSLFIMEKVYWEWTVDFHKLLEKVNDNYNLGPEGMASTRRFFYDAYSKSINGSVFDSLRMDMVSFAGELLNSNSPNEKLNGARLLRKLSTSDKFSPETLRKIGVDICVIERLVEMLNWRNPKEQELRESAAEILQQIASKNQNSLRIAEIPGAVESVASLLTERTSYTAEIPGAVESVASLVLTERTSYTGAGDEICQRDIVSVQESNLVQKYNKLGLSILNKLSRDHGNCGKIGNTRGLLPKIIDFTYTTNDMFTNQNVPEWHYTLVSECLILVKNLVSTTGITGATLRKEISEIVFTISNIRNILKNGKDYPEFQLRGIQVLTKLGLEDDATENIGATGGVLKELLNLFFMEDAESGIKEELRDAAGDAIAMLTLESKENCLRVLRLKAIDKLVDELKKETLCINSARILRNLLIYTDKKTVYYKDTELKAMDTAETVLRGILKKHQEVNIASNLTSKKEQEVLIGLALHVFKCMTHEHFNRMLETIEVEQSNNLAAALVKILKDHPIPFIKVPRIRRFSIELAIWMMEEWKENVAKFKELNIGEVLEGVIETTMDVENFHLFSGTFGISRHRKSLHTLAEEAFILVA